MKRITLALDPGDEAVDVPPPPCEPPPDESAPEEVDVAVFAAPPDAAATLAGLGAGVGF